MSSKRMFVKTDRYGQPLFQGMLTLSDKQPVGSYRELVFKDAHIDTIEATLVGFGAGPFTGVVADISVDGQVLSQIELTPTADLGDIVTELNTYPALGTFTEITGDTPGINLVQPIARKMAITITFS
jgi:hypothetical protein